MYLIYKLYFSLINNLIIVLFLFRFSENNMHTVFSIKRKIIVFTLASLYSIVPLSRFDLIISNVFFLLTLYYLSDFNLKQSIIILIKFEILLNIASAIICFLHSLLFSDAQLLYDNVIYQDYKSILVGNNSLRCLLSILQSFQIKYYQKHVLVALQYYYFRHLFIVKLHNLVHLLLTSKILYAFSYFCHYFRTYYHMYFTIW